MRNETIKHFNLYLYPAREEVSNDSSMTDDCHLVE
jgi:hypothetical protein